VGQPQGGGQPPEAWRRFRLFEDDNAITVQDALHPGELRYVTLGVDGLGRVLVVVYTWRGENIRVISARAATPRERRQYGATA